MSPKSRPPSKPTSRPPKRAFPSLPAPPRRLAVTSSVPPGFSEYPTGKTNVRFQEYQTVVRALDCPAKRRLDLIELVQMASQLDDIDIKFLLRIAGNLPRR